MTDPNDILADIELELVLIRTVLTHMFPLREDAKEALVKATLRRERPNTEE